MCVISMLFSLSPLCAASKMNTSSGELLQGRESEVNVEREGSKEVEKSVEGMEGKED